MSRWSVKRKRKIVVIAGIVLLIILGFIFIRIEQKRQPSCFDGIKNGQETGVDCGGACSRVCLDETYGLVVWWERPFKITKGVYNAVAYIENQNLYSGLRKVDYEFRLYNKDNILVAEPYRGSTFVEPNKRSAVFVSGIQTGDNEVFNVFFRILSVQDWERTPAEFSQNILSVRDPILSNQDTTPKLSAVVENKTPYSFENIPVVAIIYNSKDNAIAASQTYLDQLAQNSYEQVFYSWPEPFGESVSRIELIPRIDPYAAFHKG